MRSKNSSNKRPPTGSAHARLPPEFYLRRDTLLVARQLLGKRLVVPAEDGERVSGIIVETEAYLAPEDKASHAYNGRRTARTETMYARGGTAYVYLIYGMHHQFNVVTNRESVPHAILVRAVEPDEGVERMLARRPVKPMRALTSGPGKLCAALGIDRSLDGVDLCGESVWIEDAGRRVPGREIIAGPRVGIDYAAEFVSKPWRFWLNGNPYVSRRM